VKKHSHGRSLPLLFAHSYDLTTTKHLRGRLFFGSLEAAAGNENSTPQTAIAANSDSRRHKRNRKNLQTLRTASEITTKT
jgi:hypothetical protein